MQSRFLTTSRKAARTSIGRTAREQRIAIGIEIRRMRVDAGTTQRQLAAHARIDHGYLSLVERGLREPSLRVLAAIANGLGGSFSVRLYPGTGPRLSDPIQARIVEALVRVLDPRWTRMLEVPVYRPARGVIDLVLHDQVAGLAVAVEVHSRIHRLEQLLRWQNEKAASLSSADFWRFAEGPQVDRLLVLRSTRANRELVSRFLETFGTSFPASTTAAYRALTSPDGDWPGSALLWATVDGDQCHIRSEPPRSHRRSDGDAARSLAIGSRSQSS